ncbi:Carboxylesterase type B [Penicillium maclennaniae]|uniref:Carboxylesterase type B n=1 Tax=Penicillium maclennaniae TaxID=1343394 RepID=UPI002541B9C0|nr:Carboxylesterase type B [Penicillium maclennaniae]KAJ5678233.1 Carboxylesterase type B [Penicillium maclennaniae]
MFPMTVGAAVCLATTVFAVASPASLDSDVSILIHNDLQETSSPWSKSGVIVLGEMPLLKATEACQSLGESLWTSHSKVSTIQSGLDYLVFEHKVSRSQQYWIAPIRGVPSTVNANGEIRESSPSKHLPVLCTQSAPYSTADTKDTNSTWQINIQSNNEHITGFRDRFSFRFFGLRYAPPAKRWTYSHVYEGQGRRASALDYGSSCAQGSTGSEDCFFLNVWTPYLPGPKIGQKNLKPVMFWIHGGAFTSGMGSDPTFDGGNLASRGDVVVVAINYRLGTLGFLALDDGQTKGNYGLADQITALEWVRRNIQDFGGDPHRITIFGQSAGAGSVRALLASPKARGMFASAIMESNLGGLAYGTTYSKYYTISQEMEVVGNAIVKEANCSKEISPVKCLRGLPAMTITGLSDTARYLVVDGEYLQSSELDLTNPASTANVPLLIGTTRDDGAAMLGYPTAGDTLKTFLNESGLPMSIAPSQLFPEPSGSNHTLDIFNTTARVATDGMFRCIDQATAYAGINNRIFPEIFFYEFNRTYQMPGWSPNPPLCNAPITPEFPNGDPSQEYFKCHSGELYYVFGNVLRQSLPFRDEFDLPFEQYVLDSWASFARSANPNPDQGFLKARGYVNTTRQVETTGPWTPFRHGDYRLRRLQWPSEMVDLDETEQCRALNLPLSYYDT